MTKILGGERAAAVEGPDHGLAAVGRDVQHAAAEVGDPQVARWPGEHAFGPA